MICMQNLLLAQFEKLERVHDRDAQERGSRVSVFRGGGEKLKTPKKMRASWAGLDPYRPTPPLARSVWLLGI